MNTKKVNGYYYIYIFVDRSKSNDNPFFKELKMKNEKPTFF